jgi:hypothetical protein
MPPVSVLLPAPCPGDAAVAPCLADTGVAPCPGDAGVAPCLADTGVAPCPADAAVAGPG